MSIDLFYGCAGCGKRMLIEDVPIDQLEPGLEPRCRACEATCGLVVLDDEGLSVLTPPIRRRLHRFMWAAPVVEETLEAAEDAGARATLFWLPRGTR